MVVATSREDAEEAMNRNTEREKKWVSNGRMKVREE
jgi:hypothetical protein